MVKLLITGGFMVCLCACNQTPYPVKPVTKSVVEHRAERYLPPDTIRAITLNSSYPRTMLAIAAVESGRTGTPHTTGDKGKAIGVFQVQPQHWGSVEQTLEAQIKQADRVFHTLVERHGYREAVKRYNGKGIKAAQYRTRVYAVLRTLEKGV